MKSSPAQAVCYAASVMFAESSGRRLKLLVLLASIPFAIADSASTHAQDGAPLPEDAPLADDADALSTSTSTPAPAPVKAKPEKLRLRLREADAERAHSSNLLPWLTVGIGAGTVVVSALAGAIHALGCDPGCSTPNWVALIVVAGGAVGTLGAIWLIRTDESLRELDSRRYQLRQELEQYELSSRHRDRESARNGGPTFNLRLSF
jgi:hypothetical protein